jgi:ComF family protein
MLLALASEPACEACAAPLPAGGACARCGGDGFHPFGKIVALAPFRDPLRTVVHEMKFHHRWPVAEILADRMLAQQRVRNLLDETDLLVPIPLHWSRQIQRGYNQSDTLARRLARHRRQLRVLRPIVRLKNTPAQTTVHSRADRDTNLRFAFGLVNAKPIQGARVTLVDDVMTTGSTLKAAARVISDGSPCEINAIVLSVADPRRTDFQII